MNLTKSAVEKLPSPTKGYTLHWDDTLPGFGVRVTHSGAKSYIVQKRIGHKEKRITLGSHHVMSADTARKEAMKILGQIASGIDPVAKAQEAKLKTVTLNQVYQDYLIARKDLKPKTLYDYRRVVDVTFASWKSKPLLSISKDMVEKKHSSLGQDNGEAYANLCMRVLRALFNFAAGKYEDSQGKTLVTENPVKRLSQTRAWYRVERRQTVIKSHDLATWYHGVMALEETPRDYLLLILFTGLRRNEAATLTWSAVDLKAKTLTITETKNGESHTLPLSDYLLRLLVARKQKASTVWVFPADSASGHLVDIRKQMAKVGVAFTVHDLRRTFITTAESLDIPAYALKRLVNHKMTRDVTAGYIITDTERLREPMQKITDFILRSAGVKPSAAVIPLYKTAEFAS